MSVKKLKWNNLLHLTELEFEPEEPKQLSVSDELVIAISWLTAATKHDRKLLRCDDNGALLTTNPWTLLSPVENDELSYDVGVPDTFTATSPNKGVLVSSGAASCLLSFVRVQGGDSEDIYVPPNWLYWYPHTVYSVTTTIIAGSGGSGIAGITTFN